jgi:type 1 fimbria pilin
MKRILPLLLAVGLIVPLLLTACSTKPLKAAYTASGDGNRPEDLEKTTVFKPDDDLNVVITLNSHNRTLPVKAVFIAPDGVQYATDEIKMDETAGVAVLGLDWEMQNNTLWTPGDWKVEVYVDNTREDTLNFTVQAADTTGAG